MTSPGNVVDVVRSVWPDVPLSAAQERLYAEYLKDVDPDVLRRVLPTLAVEWDHPAPPGIMRAAVGDRAKRAKRTKTWVAVGVAAGIAVVVSGGILGAATVNSGGGGRTTAVAATGAITPPTAAHRARHHTETAPARRLAPTRPCASFYDAKLGGTARIEFGVRGRGAGVRYVTTPPDPSAVNCTSARRVIRDLGAGQGTRVPGRRAVAAYTLVDGWKCVAGADATVCSTGARSFIAGTGL